MESHGDPRVEDEWYWAIENWHGSFFEVAIELGPHDDARLRSAFTAAWSTPSFDGPLDSPYPERPRGVPDGRLEPERSIFTYGTVVLPDAPSRVGCEVLSVRDDESDWLDVAIPTAMLELVYPVTYPIVDEGNPWAPNLARFLASVADRVYAAVPFDLAIVGEEASGSFYANSRNRNRAITRDVADRAGGFLLSPALRERLGPVSTPEVLSSGLLWLRPTGRRPWGS